MSTEKKDTLIRPEKPTVIKPFSKGSEANPQEENNDNNKVSMSEHEEVVCFKAEHSAENSIDSDEIEDALIDLKQAADESIG